MTNTEVQAKVTKTAAFDGASIDISGFTAANDWTLVIEVLAMNDANTVRFNFEDSVDAFTAKLPGPTLCIAGSITATNPRRFTFRKYDFPALRFGTASAVLRLALAEILGSSKSVTYKAWIES